MPEQAFPWSESKTPTRNAKDILADIEEIEQRFAPAAPKKASEGGVVRLAEFGVPLTKRKVVVESKDTGDSAWSDALERSTAQIAGSIDYTASLLGRLAERARIPGAKEYADRKLDESIDLFSYAEKRPARVSLEELVKSPTFSKTGTFLAEVAGEQLPNLLLTFGAGGIAGAAAKRAAVSAATKQIASRGGARGAMTSARQAAINRYAGAQAGKAGTIAATATVAPLEAGEAGYGIRQETGEDSPLIALGAGAVNAYLEKLVPERILKDIFSADGAAKKMLWRDVLKNTASTVTRNLAQEGLTEVAQESVQIAATKLADSSYEALTRDNFWRLLEAGVKGAIVGGSISVPTSGYSQTRRKLQGDLDTEISRAAEKIDKEITRRRDEQIKQQATREKDTPATSSTTTQAPPVTATPGGAPTEQSAPEQADESAAQGVVATGNERTLNGTKYTKRDDFWYYTDKRGREKIVEGGTTKQDNLLEELEAPTTNPKQISSSLGVRESRAEPDLDAEYAAAFERGDEASAAKMVEAAAKSAGRWIPDPPKRADFYRLYLEIGAKHGYYTADEVERYSKQFSDPATQGETKDEREISFLTYWLADQMLRTDSASNFRNATADARAVVGAVEKPRDARRAISAWLQDSRPTATVFVGNPDGTLIPLSQRFGRGTQAQQPASATPPAATPQALPSQPNQSGGDLLPDAQVSVRDSAIPTQESTTRTLPPINANVVMRAVQQIFGRTPERLQVVYEPNAPWNARLVGGVIQLNGAKLDEKDVSFKIAHELGHLLYRTPVFRDAFSALLNSLSTEERQSVLDAVALYKEQPQSIQDEESQVRALEEILRTMKQPQNQTAWQRFTDMVAEAFYSFFGVQPTSREELAARVVAVAGADFVRGGLADGGTRESLVAPSQDAAYMDAVNRGDMVTAQRIVDDAARRMGLIGPLWRGGKSPIKDGAHVYYLSNNEWLAGTFSEPLPPGRFFIRADNILDADSEVRGPVARSSSLTETEARRIRAAGYDAVQGEMSGPGGHEIAVFDFNQIKSADPVTYDDAGNVIPLSQRFNPERDDIRYDLVTDASQAQRKIDIQSTPEQQQIDAASIFTQSSALLNPLKRIADAMGASPRVKAMLGLQRLERVLSVLPDWVKKLNYDAMMAELTDPGARKNAQWDVFQRLMVFQDDHEARKRKLRDIIAMMRGSEFRLSMDKAATAEARLKAKASLSEQFKTIISGATARAMSRLERETDSREEQVLRDEIRALEKQQGLSVGVSETVTQIINDLVRDSDALEALSGAPTAQQLLSEWRRVNPEAPTTTPTARFAAYILARNTKLGPKLARLQEILTKPEIADEVSRTEKIIRNALTNAKTDIERAAVMTKYLDKANDKKNAEFRAYRRWFDLNQSIQREVEKFNNLTEAIRIGEAVINDDEFKRVRMETQKAVDAVVTPSWWNDKKRKEFGEKVLKTKTDPSTMAEMGIVHVVLPDGTWHVHELSADKKNLEKAVEALSADAAVITDWLSENPDSPYAPYYQIQLDQIRGTYLTSLVGENNKNLALLHGIPILSSPIGMLRWALKDIGTPSAKIAAKLAAAWDIHSEFMETWMPTWYPGAVKSLYAAADSHKFQQKAKEEGNSNWFVMWSEEVGNELMARLQNIGSGVEVGSILSTGHRVTKEDMAYVKYIQRATSAAYAKVDAPLQSVSGLPDVQDYIANRIPVIRERLDRGDVVLPRRLNRTLAPVVSSLMKLLRSGPPSERIAMAEEMIDKELWPQVESYLHDRHPDFTRRTRLTDALKLAGERLKEKRAADIDGKPYELPYPEPNMQGLYDFLAGHIDTTEEEGSMTKEQLAELVRSEFLGAVILNEGTTAGPNENYSFRPGEFGRILETFESNASNDEDLTQISEVTILDHHNSFNSSRGRRIAPYGFYKHGLISEGDWLNFRSNGASFQMEMMIQSLRAVKLDLENKLAAVRQQFGVDGKLPSPAILEGRERLESGDTMYEWDKLQQQIDEIEKFVSDLESAYGKKGRANQHEMRRLSRVVGMLVRGLLSSGLVAIGNVISPQAAAVRASMEGSAMHSFARAYANLAKVFFKMAGGAIKSVPPAAKKALSAMGNANFPDVIGAWEELFEGAIQRSGVNKELKRLGLDKPLRIQQKLEAMNLMPTTGGRLIEWTNRTGATGSAVDMIGKMATAFEALLTLAEPLQPEYGDRLINAAAYEDGVGLTAWVEDSMRKLYGRYKAAGRDPKTAPLNASDFYGGWLGRKPTQSNLNNLTEWFNLAGLPLREQVHRFFDALDAADNKAEVSMFTPGERDVMATVMVPEINKATRSTRPIFTSTSFTAQMMFLLKGWSFFDITRKRHRFGMAANVKGADRMKGRVQQMMLLLLVSSMMGAVGWDLVEILKRYWARLLRGEERASRAWWEQEGWDKARGILKSQGTQWPIIGDAITGFMDDMPGSARQGALFNPVVLSKLTDIGRYFAGVASTGDPRFGFSQLAKGIIAEPAAVVLNSLPTESGAVAQVNARRLLSRFGDKEWLVKPMGFSMAGSANYTPLHPVVERAVNAIGNGDFDKFQRYYDEAVAMAEEDGKDYRTVLSMLKSRHPVKRAYGKAVPADIMEKFLSRMGDDRAMVEDAIQKFDTAVAMVSPVKTKALPAVSVGSYGSPRTSKVNLTPVYARGSAATTTRSRSSSGRRPTLPTRLRMPTLAQSMARRSNARRRPTIRI